MNTPIFFNYDYTGELNIYIPPLPSSSSSSSSSIELTLCQRYGYYDSPNSCGNPIEIIVENTICYTCGEVIVPSSSSSSSSSSEPFYFISPNLISSSKKISLNYSGDLLAFGLTNPIYNYNISGQSSVQLFKRNPDYTWQFVKKLIGDFDSNFADFGNSIKFNKSGDRIIIGAPSDDSFSIFTGKDLNWFSEKITGKKNTDFGYQVTCNEDGTKVFISAPKDDGGKVYLYTGVTNSLNYNLDYIFSGDIDENINYGHSISTNYGGDLIAVGAPTYKSGIGAAYIYQKQNNIWNQTIITGSSLWSFFGFNVAINSKEKNIFQPYKLLVASILENNSKGCVYVYNKLDNFSNDWLYYQKLSGKENNENFGLSLSINEDATNIAISNTNNKISLYSGEFNYYLYRVHNKDVVGFGNDIDLSQDGKILTASTDTSFYVFTDNDLRLNTIITIEDIPTKKYLDEPFLITVESNRSGDFFYSLEKIQSTSEFDPCRIIDSGLIEINSPGISILKIYQLENEIYKSGHAETSIIINKADQNINLKSLPDRSFGDLPFRILDNVTDAGLIVNFSSNNSSAVKITNGNLLNIVGGGTVSILATQNGDAFYNAAPSVSGTFNINKADQYINFLPLKEYFLERSPVLLPVTSTSNLPVSIISSNNTILEIQGNQALIFNTGSVILEAKQLGNNNYNPAQPIIKRINILKETQDCLDLANITTNCDCGNNCRNCCGIDFNINANSYFKNNQNKYNLNLTLDIYNRNCDDIGDFIKIYCNNKLMYTQYYFVKKNNTYSNTIEVKNISYFGDFINVKCVAEEFGRQNFKYLSLRTI
jgi:hypothetical protein